MLYPQNNRSRSVTDLSGIWDFRLRETDEWQTIAVPASYNDQKADPAFRSHAGKVWYRTKVTVPVYARDLRRFLRFDAVTHKAAVYLNGVLIAEHTGGFLPFSADITDMLAPGETGEMVVEADNIIDHRSLPVGNEGAVAFFGSDNPGIPSVEAGKRRQAEAGINLPNFDFFNYAGINRPVRLCMMPRDHIEDITVTADTDGSVRVRTETAGEGTPLVRVLDASGRCVAEGAGADCVLKIPDPVLWEPRPGTPYLYRAAVSFGEDYYEEEFGIRSVEVRGTQFLINGKPFYFRGPCKHEDFFIHGRGLDQALNVADISRYKWMHANAFRTSHYPYAEEMYRLCDREGIVIIDETPAVGIGAGPDHDPYTEWGPGTGAYHSRVLEEMIRRDKNHPCVVMWSLGNEPDTEHFPCSAYDYWMPLYRQTHEQDPQSRPVTLVGCQNDYTKDITVPAMDVVCINRYYGWYNLSGDLENAKFAFRTELDWWDHVGKPVILSEYGADTVNGLHGVVPEMFTEEFQVEYYEAINACLDERPYVTGELPWNFADFGTQQGPMRSGGNRKGLFTRTRDPKMAAHYFRRRWSNMEAREQENGKGE